MDPKQEIISYIRLSQEQGVPANLIKNNLLSAGWTEVQINEAFYSANTPSVPRAPASSPMPDVSASNFSHPGSVGAKSKPSYHPRTILEIVGCVVLIAFIGVAYAYVEKIGPFSSSMYAENNLLSGMLTKSASIKTSAYSMAMGISVGPRDKDAKPFTLEIKQDNLIKQYQNDSKRATDIQGIMGSLVYSQKSYPSTLQALKSSNGAYYYSNFSIVDPSTRRPYGFTLTDNGSNFAIKVTFETKDAISQIRHGYNFKEADTKIDGQTVTFTKASPSYFYLSAEPPKPLFATLGEEAKYLPGEFKINAAISAKTDWSAGALADWIFNIDANGDFGDLTYKVNIDALKKDKYFYFKINNIPSIFLMLYSNVKGEWIKVSTKDEGDKSGNDYSYDPLSSIAGSFSKEETSYKENRKEIVNLIQKAAQFADEEKLIAFKNKPAKETVDGRELTRYDLKINKNAVLPFYQKLVAEARTSKTFSPMFEDSGLVEYFQSPEFDKVFDYYQDNTTFIVWVDSAGYPAIIEEKLRLVPPDNAQQLKDKQANLTLALKIYDINKPVNIETPSGAKSLEDILGPSFKEARNTGKNTSIKAGLANMRAQAELYYDSHSGYGTASSSCTSGEGTLFSDTNVAAQISMIKSTLKDVPKATVNCYSKPTAWAASASLIDTNTQKGYWCVDNTGSSKLVTKAAFTTSCP